MQIERMAYIIDFHGKEVPKRLLHMDVNLAYVSKRANYAIVYCDTARGEKSLVQQLQKVKGFIRVKPSLFYEETKNI